MSFGMFLNQAWTIARHSILQAIRMKVALVLIAFLIIFVPTLPFLLKSDKTHVGQLQMIITYSLYFIGFLLSILTLFLSAITLNTEIKQQQIFLLDPKPVPRIVVLFGKWFGVMVISISLLAAMLGASYGLVRYHARQWPNEPASEYARVENEVLMARSIRVPNLPENLYEMAEQEYKHMEEKGTLPTNKSENWVMTNILMRLQRGAWRVPPNGVEVWKFEGLPKYKGGVTVVFRNMGEGGSGRLEAEGRFTIGDGISVIKDNWLVNKKHTFTVPSDVIKDDGTVEVKFENLETDVAMLFSYGDGIQVKYRTGTLAGNYVRAGIMMAGKLAFIAIVGIFASTFLSFPVAIVASMLVLIVGQLSSFIYSDMLEKMYLFGASAVAPGTPLNPADMVIRKILGFFFGLFPNFSAYDVTPLLANGTAIHPKTIVGMFVTIILIRGGILALGGWWIFRRRELAALSANI